MSESLRHALRREVMGAFAEGTDKHAERRSDTGREKIYSYTSRNHLLDVINTFIKETPDLPKSPSELSKKDVVRFLDKKAADGVTQKTLDTYRSDLMKLGRLINVDLNADRVLSGVAKAPDRGAGDVISHDDLTKLIHYAKEHPSASGMCIQLERLIGVRVGDIAYGVKVEADQLRIRCKNGKICYRKMNPALKEIIDSKEFRAMVDPDTGKFEAPKDDSINKYLRRTEDRLGLDRHSFQAIRRRIAQDCYNYHRNHGCGRTEALKKTSLWLNHGENREKMLLESYISDAW